MVSIICGPRGSGKTEKIIDSANKAAEVCKGSIIFITDTSEYSRNIKNSIRFINIKEYLKVNEDSFVGFVAGIMASNSDIEKIYIDGLARAIKMDAKNLVELVTKLDILSDKLSVNFYLTITADKVPTGLKKYIK